MKTQARFTLETVRHDQDTDAHLVVTMEAPKTEWQKKRPPVCVIPVIDVSGSMNSPPEKLEKAKNSVLKLIDQLQPGDYCGIAAFSTDVHPIAKPREMTQAQKDDLKAKVGALRSESSTNFSGGMLLGLEWANAADLPEGVIVRIIMFTDGCANAGVARDRESILRVAKANLGRASLSCFGYGDDADQELLGDLAKACGGNYAFIKNPDDALTAFAKELGGLLSTYAQNLELVFEAQNGHKLVEVVSDVDAEEKGGKVHVRIPDILSEEVRHVVLSVKLHEQPQALPREMSVVTVGLTYETLSESGEKKAQQESLKAKVRFVKAGEEQKEPDKALGEIVGRDLMVKAQVEAESLANSGNFAGAAAVMDSYSLDMERQGHEKLANVGKNLRRKVESKSLYSASAGYRNVMKHGMTRAVGISGMDEEALCSFEEAGVQVSTSSQQGMVDNMVGGGTVNAPNPLINLTGAAAPPPAAPFHPAPSKPKAEPKPKEKKGLSKSRSQRW